MISAYSIAQTSPNNGNQRRSIIVYYGSRSTPHTLYQEGARRGVIPVNVRTPFAKLINAVQFGARPVRLTFVKQQGV